ncbi:MAG: hypothetical protein ACRDOH_15385 [Streptosporangiaceae bacterium]
MSRNPSPVSSPGARPTPAGNDGRAHSAGQHGDYARSIRLAGTDWLLACAADPALPAPALPR